MHALFNIFLAVLFVSFPAYSHIVKEGETLANIVRKYYTIPPFGKNGGVNKILSINKHIKNPDLVRRGTVIKLNTTYLKPNILDDETIIATDAATDVSTSIAKSDAPANSQAEVEPYIEVERPNNAENTIFSKKIGDHLNFYLSFYFNNLKAKKHSTTDTFNLNTSTETAIGAEYTKQISENFILSARALLNQFSISEVTTITPTLAPTRKTQVAGALGGNYLFTENNYVVFEAAYQPHFYLIQDSTGNLVLDYAASPSFNLGTENFFYNTKDFNVGASLGIEYISNAKSLSNGLAFGFGLLYQQNFIGFDKLRIKLDYKQTSLDSELYNLVNNSVALNLIYSLPE